MCVQRGSWSEGQLLHFLQQFKVKVRGGLNGGLNITTLTQSFRSATGSIPNGGLNFASGPPGSFVAIILDEAFKGEW